MSQTEHRVEAAFRQVIEAEPWAECDWDDVTDRSTRLAPARPRRRRLQRRQLGGLLLAAVVVVLGVPGLGIGARLVNLVDTPPAVSPQTELRSFNHPGPWNPRVIAGKARHVFTERTPAGPVTLWTAPTRRHGTCYLLRFGQGSAGGCLGHETFHHGLAVGLAYLSKHASASSSGPVVRLVNGHVSDRTTRLVVTYADGRAVEAPLHEHWFVVVIHGGPAQRPISVSAYDSDGHLLRREPIPPPPSLIPHRVVELPTPATIRRVASVRLPDGSTATLWVGRGEKGHPCDRVLVDGKSIRGPAWQCGATVGGRLKTELTARGVVRDTPLRWDPSVGGEGAGALPLAFGWAAAPVHQVRVRYADGGVTPVRLYDRLFLYVAPQGRAPRLLQGLDEHGKVIASLPIDRRRCGPGGVKWKCSFP